MLRAVKPNHKLSIFEVFHFKDIPLCFSSVQITIYISVNILVLASHGLKSPKERMQEELLPSHEWVPEHGTFGSLELTTLYENIKFQDHKQS